MSSSNQAFTKKLRTAIKAKIQEYKIDADDELPDYVMVLAANRKDKQQMKTDLNLFLGKHTATFIEWLFEAFDRIQKSEGEPDKSDSKKPNGSSQTSGKKSTTAKHHDSDECEFVSAKQGLGTSRETSNKNRAKRSPSVESLSPPVLRSNKAKIVSSRKPNDERSPEHQRSRNDRPRIRARSPSPARRKARSRSRSPRREDTSRQRTHAKKDRHEDKHKDEDVAPKKRKEEETTSKKRKPDNLKSEKSVTISESDGEKSSPETSNRQKRARRSTPPKIRSEVVVPKTSSPTTSKVSKHVSMEKEERVNELVYSDEETLRDEGDVDKAATTATRFIIRVGNRKICRTVSSDPVDPQGASERVVAEKTPHEPDLADIKKRKRHADDPGKVVSRIMKGQDLSTKPSSTLTARMERFGKENSKRGRVGESSKSPPSLSRSKSADQQADVEPYSPAPVKSAFSDDESQIDATIAQLAQALIPQPIIPQHIFAQPGVITEQLDEMGKIAQRCRFWPNCEKGVICPFYHPSKLCTKFPNCFFAEKCLYIHPLCKFNLTCTKPHCPYTHDANAKPTFTFVPDTRRAPISAVYSHPAPIIQAAAPPKKIPDDSTNQTTNPTNIAIPCRFKNKCTNFKCDFLHPPLCKFGLGCRTPRCGFLHRRPDFKKFQWTSSHV